MRRAFWKLGELPNLRILSFSSFTQGDLAGGAFPLGNDVASIKELKAISVGLPALYPEKLGAYLHDLVDGLLTLEHLTDVVFSCSPMLTPASREVARFIQSSTKVQRVRLYASRMDVETIAVGVENSNVALERVSVHEGPDRDRIVAAFAKAKRRHGIASMLAFDAAASQTVRSPAGDFARQSGDRAASSRVFGFLVGPDPERNVHMREGDE